MAEVTATAAKAKAKAKYNNKNDRGNTNTKVLPNDQFIREREKVRKREETEPIFRRSFQIYTTFGVWTLILS